MKNRKTTLEAIFEVKEAKFDQKLSDQKCRPHSCQQISLAFRHPKLTWLGVQSLVGTSRTI